MLHNSQKLKDQVKIIKLQTFNGIVTLSTTIAKTLNELIFREYWFTNGKNIQDVEVDAIATVNPQSHISRTFFFLQHHTQHRNVNRLVKNKQSLQKSKCSNKIHELWQICDCIISMQTMQ